MRKPAPAELDEIRPASRAAWRRWLAAHHDRSRGVWLVRRRGGRAALSITDAVEEALCFGWIDSRLQVVDADRTRLMFTPRRARSIWSSSNKQRVASLIRRGLMTGAGLRAVDTARRNGSWNALDAVDALLVPPDLKAALAAHPVARARFERAAESVRKQELWAVYSAKRPETRAWRIADAVRRFS